MTKAALSIFLSIGSIVGFIAGWVCLKWVNETEQTAANVARELSLVPFSFSDARRMVLIEQGLSILVFLASEAFCRFREWVNFEISATVGTDARVVAVEAGGWISLDIRLDCHEVIPWDSVEIQRVVRSAQRS